MKEEVRWRRIEEGKERIGVLEFAVHIYILPRAKLGLLARGLFLEADYIGCPSLKIDFRRQTP